MYDCIRTHPLNIATNHDSLINYLKYAMEEFESSEQPRIESFWPFKVENAYDTMASPTLNTSHRESFNTQISKYTTSLQGTQDEHAYQTQKESDEFQEYHVSATFLLF